MFAIFVTINIKPDQADAFREASFGDANGSIRDEPGCFRFDILQDGENPNRFYLYEVYKDPAAFQAHLVASHFKTWRSAVTDMFDGNPERIEMSTVFPTDAGWDSQKAALCE